MNRIIKIMTSLVMAIFVFVACMPEDYSLGNVDVKSGDLVEGIAFKIEHDKTNPNIVYLTSLMDSKYTPLWVHPQGRSQEKVVTLKIPFAGTYEVQFGVETRGGIVYGDKATFKVNDMYAGFISDEMWTMLAGGAGKEKTWYLDLDKDKVSRHFLGPIYFFTNTYKWDNLHTPNGDNYLDADAWDWKNAITPRGNADGSAAEWYWLADYPGNSWMCDPADFGTMTFDLKNAANVTVDQSVYGLGSHKGTFLLDTEKHTIGFTDARPLHDSNRDNDVKTALEYRILYISDNFLQILVVPPGDATGICYNYISKEYRDNWVPGDKPDPEPPYNGNANDDLTTSTTTTKKWKLSANSPYNWTNLAGGFLNSWSKPQDYTDTGWAPYDASLIKNISLTMTRTSNVGGDYIFTDGDGKEIKGSYTVDEKNNVNFGKNISFALSGWVSLATTSENSLRLLITEKDALGNISGMWLGQRSSEKDEYMAYHFEPAPTGGSDDAETVLKKTLCAKTWKLDMNATVKPDGNEGGSGPMTFTDEAYSWTWWPAPGTHYGAGDAGADYGTMKFNLDGTVTVLQNTVEGGKTTGSKTLTGSWTFNASTNKLKISVGMLHPTTASYAVADWGDATLKVVNSSYLRLWVMRSEALSGEGAVVMMYNYIPVN